MTTGAARYLRILLAFLVGLSAAIFTFSSASTSPQTANYLPNAAAAATRAVASAGLMDPTSDFADYLTTVPSEQGWLATFGLDSCDGCSDSTLEVLVNEHDGSLHVEGVEGEISESQRRIIQDYEEPVSSRVGWSVLSSVAKQGRVEASLLWDGPVSMFQTGASCKAVGEPWSSLAYDIGSPSREADRSGQVLSIGLAGSPSSLRETDVRIICSDVIVRPWRPTAAPQIRGNSPEETLVSLPVQWSSARFTDAFTRCEVEVFSEDGSSLGSTKLYVGPPPIASGHPPFDDLALGGDLRVDPSAVSRAAVDCSLISPEAFEDLR